MAILRSTENATARWTILRRNLIAGLGLTLMLSRANPSLSAATLPVEDLTHLSLEELMNVEVTSVSKQSQSVAHAAAAIFVVSQEDIRRSGATSIPEALRMVPGLQVARLDSNKWAISSRGFNSRFANKLLVLIDGRTVYTPLFSGVHWDVQDTLMEDIERIEVIRGPGATLWGANAVNGVINIITKKAKDTQGALAVAGTGTEERGFTGIRYGIALAENTHIRTYGKFFARDNQATATGDPANDRWHQSQGGLRLDHTAGNGDFLTLQGDYYAGQSRDQLTSPILTAPFSQTTDQKTSVSGWNVLGRWTHATSSTSGLTLQAYYDRTERTNSTGGERNIVDLDLQHHFAWGSTHNLIWGAGYRFTDAQLVNSHIIQFNPAYRKLNIWSGFLQDNITLIPETVILTLGTKVEHNDLTGMVIQPNARLLWMPTPRQTVWASVSRAVRTPAQGEDDARINLSTMAPTPFSGGLPVEVAAIGNRGYGNEKLLAYELGYRNQITTRLSIDLTAFYNNYKDLRTFDSATPVVEPVPAPTHLLIPLDFGNRLRAETIGVEAVVEWRPVEWWRVQPSYTYLHMHLFTDRTTDPNAANAQGESPSHQVSIRSQMTLPHHLELDLWGRYMHQLPAIHIPSYVTLDARIGWKPLPQLELSLVGQNLLDQHRLEFREQIVNTAPTEIQRGVYGKVTWRF